MSKKIHNFQFQKVIFGQDNNYQIYLRLILDERLSIELIIFFENMYLWKIWIFPKVQKISFKNMIKNLWKKQ